MKSDLWIASFPVNSALSAETLTAATDTTQLFGIINRNRQEERKQNFYFSVFYYVESVTYEVYLTIWKLHHSDYFHKICTWVCPTSSQCFVSTWSSNSALMSPIFMYISVAYPCCVIEKQYMLSRRSALGRRRWGKYIFPASGWKGQCLAVGTIWGRGGPNQSQIPWSPLPHPREELMHGLSFLLPKHNLMTYLDDTWSICLK